MSTLISDSPKVRDRIYTMLEIHGDELRGTGSLADELKLKKNKTYVIDVLKKMEEQGLITIIRSCGGRGHKTVYKRNRNQAGLARKVRNE